MKVAAMPHLRSFTVIQLFALCSFLTVHCNNSLTVEQTLDTITKGYNKNLRPNFEDGPVHVIANTYIVAVDQIDDVKSDFMVKMYFTQRWNDTRLAYGKKFPGLTKKHTLRIMGEIANDIWTPDTYVENQEGPDGRDFSSVQLGEDGEVTLSERMVVRGNCPTMDLTSFPHDEQRCYLLMTSFVFPNTDIHYLWREPDPVFVGESPIASQYFLVDTKTEHEDKYFTSANATWGYLRLDFYLRRKIAYYVIRIYLPAILVTLTSWVSFWINPKVIPARLSLCVITVLAMTTLSYSSQSMVPAVPYVKAVDVYLIISFCFVFGSLAEYAILLNFSKGCTIIKQRAPPESPKKEAIPLKRRNSDVDIEDGEANNNGAVSAQPARQARRNYFADWTLDTWSTVFFPVVYAAFHMFYFIVILSQG